MSRPDLIEYRNLIEHAKNLAPNEISIAKFVAKVWKNKYCLTTDGGKDRWFKFNGERWETSNAIKYELQNKISDEIPDFIVEARRDIREELQNTNTDQTVIDIRMKRILHVEQMLYSISTVNTIIKALESRLYREKLPEIALTI